MTLGFELVDSVYFKQLKNCLVSGMLMSNGDTIPEARVGVLRPWDEAEFRLLEVETRLLFASEWEDQDLSLWNRVSKPRSDKGRNRSRGRATTLPACMRVTGWRQPPASRGIKWHNPTVESMRLLPWYMVQINSTQRLCRHPWQTGYDLFCTLMSRCEVQ